MQRAIIGRTNHKNTEEKHDNKTKKINVHICCYCFPGTMLACQENMDRRQNTFELYGADFMISEDFCPWLIEINASPDLAPSTSVTARLCPQAVEDTIKGICGMNFTQFVRF